MINLLILISLSQQNRHHLEDRGQPASRQLLR